jgi:hypothetical protein
MRPNSVAAIHQHEETSLSFLGLIQGNVGQTGQPKLVFVSSQPYNSARLQVLGLNCYENCRILRHDAE